MALAILILFPNYPSADFCTASKMVAFHLSIFFEHPIEFWMLKKEFLERVLRYFSISFFFVGPSLVFISLDFVPNV